MKTDLNESMEKESIFQLNFSKKKTEKKKLKIKKSIFNFNFSTFLKKLKNYFIKYR
jgi:hypothetical protein